jgi:peptidoglycan/xylan/chitin deacetylase (PgdA/CDA1 family)
MCLLCRKPSRREFLGGVIALPLSLGAPHHGLLEPVLRLPPSPAHGSSAPGRVAVTLDACPGHFDPRIATTLVAHKIPATIFITSIWMKWNPQGLAYFLAHPDIFSLENHGAKHLPPVLGNRPVYGLPVAGSLDAIRTEVLDGAASIHAATGKRPLWYRGAAGLYSPQAIPFIEGLGFRIAGYSLNSDQGASLPAATVAKRIIAARDGDVIEGHINQPKRVSGAGIATGIAALQANGMSFTTLDTV